MDDSVSSDFELGREVARELWKRGLRKGDFLDPLSKSFAEGALSELESLQANTDGVIKEVLAGAEYSAEQLNLQPFHGFLEVVQNADDLTASTLSVAVRKRAGKYQLLICHNGERVRLQHVIAMSLAFISTKREDAKAIGRFGIGLKTLNELGSCLSVHCSPYSFAIDNNSVRQLELHKPVENFYDPKLAQTLFVLELHPGFKETEFKAWFDELGAETLLFLENIKKINYVDLRRRKVTKVHQIKIISEYLVQLPLTREKCKIVEIREPNTRNRWVRYEVDRKIPTGISRKYKAAATTTPVAIVLPRHTKAESQIYTGLPLGVSTALPFDINAQFDIDTARQGIRHKEYNSWLIERAAELISSVIIYLFKHDPTLAWAAVPLVEENVASDDTWLKSRIEDAVTNIQNKVRRHFSIEIAGQPRRLREIAFEAEALDGQLGQTEINTLRPALSLLPLDLRDTEGRWRPVLQEMGRATKIEVEEAIELFDREDEKLAARSLKWFIDLCWVGLEHDLGEKLWYMKCIYTADGTWVIPPTADADGRLLLKGQSRSTLAYRLGLVDVIHSEYLSDANPSKVVREWLEEKGMLHDTVDASTTLMALAHQERHGSQIYLNDQDLIDVRNLVEKTFEEIDRNVLTSIGNVIVVDAQYWEKNKKHDIHAKIKELYLPASIEDKKDGWSKAAGKTPQLKWLHPRYNKILQRKRKAKQRRPLGAFSFFKLLGAENTPRLIEPQEFDSRYGDRASPIQTVSLFQSQKEARSKLERYVSHLKGDMRSPVLLSVLRNIRREKKLQVRRERTRALLSTLEREWDRVYASYLTATAVYSSFSWIRAGNIPTTWVSMAMDEPWLLNESKNMLPARELAIRTDATLAIFGEDRDFFARDIDETFAASPVIKAFQITTNPNVSELVEQLQEIRANNSPPDIKAINLRYAAISAACKNHNPSPEEKVGDLTVRQVRTRFGAQGSKPGLIYMDGTWMPPSSVFLGAPIFGTRRSFVSSKSSASVLWQVLNIKTPNMRDCIDVLREIASAPPNDEDNEVLSNTYLYIEKLIQIASPQEKRRLRGVPLWNGLEWTKKRPIYVSDNVNVRTGLSQHVNVWQLPTVTTQLKRFVQLFEATQLTSDDFDASVHKNAEKLGQQFQTRFTTGIEILEEWLVRHDPKLATAILVSWEELRRLKIAYDPDLELTLRVPNKKPVSFIARTHINRQSLTVYISDERALEEDDAVGQAIASFFADADHDKLALAWAACWAKAKEGQRGNVKFVEEVGSTAALDDLYKQSEKPAKPTRTRSNKKAPLRDKPTFNQPAEEQVRRLKNLDHLTDKKVFREQGAKTQKSKTKSEGKGLRSSLPTGETISGKKPARQSAPRDYSNDEKEALALQVLQLAINGEGADMRDFRHLRGVGADAVDKLKRYFEIKAHFGSMPGSVTLTGNEAERALLEREKFFLAVVSGLEDGYETIVRIFPDPLRTLNLAPNTSVIVSGLTEENPALEVRFVDAKDDESEG